MRLPPISIATLVETALVAAATLVLGTAGYSGYGWFGRHERDDFRRTKALVADQIANALALPMWNFDSDQIGRVLDAAMQDRDIQAISARAAGDHASVAARARGPDWSVRPVAVPSTPPPGRPREQRTIRVAGEAVGQLDVVLTTEFLEQRLRKAALSIVLLIGAVDGMIVVGLYLLLRGAVLQPLRELERAALSFSRGETAYQGIPAGRYRGELESLRRSLDLMVAMLANRYAALQESEKRLAQVFRAIPDAVMLLDLGSRRFVEINEGFEKLLGYTREEVLGKTSVDLGLWIDLAERVRLWETFERDGQLTHFQAKVKRKDGQIRHCLLSAERLEISGRPSIVVASRDMTDRFAAEARARQARDEFPRRLIASQEAERRRIAGELHDSLGQNLLLIKNRAHLALASGETPPACRAQFQGIEEMATQAIAEVRQISHDLRPYQLDQLGLTRALRGLLADARESGGIACGSRIDDVDDLFTADAAVNVYRIVQESLSNLLKHAQARHGQVLLERDLTRVRLLIEDDGRGFSTAESATAAGFGLRSIAERASLLGGTLRIESTPGRGTAIELTIPFPEDL